MEPFNQLNNTLMGAPVANVTTAQFAPVDFEQAEFDDGGFCSPAGAKRHSSSKMKAKSKKGSKQNPGTSLFVPVTVVGTAAVAGGIYLYSATDKKQSQEGTTKSSTSTPKEITKRTTKNDGTTKAKRDENSRGESSKREDPKPEDPKKAHPLHSDERSNHQPQPLQVNDDSPVLQVQDETCISYEVEGMPNEITVNQYNLSKGTFPTVKDEYTLRIVESFCFEEVPAKPGDGPAEGSGPAGAPSSSGPTEPLLSSGPAGGEASTVDTSKQKDSTGTEPGKQEVEGEKAVEEFVKAHEDNDAFKRAKSVLVVVDGKWDLDRQKKLLVSFGMEGISNGFEVFLTKGEHFKEGELVYHFTEKTSHLVVTQSKNIEGAAAVMAGLPAEFTRFLYQPKLQTEDKESFMRALKLIECGSADDSKICVITEDDKIEVDQKDQNPPVSFLQGVKPEWDEEKGQVIFSGQNEQEPGKSSSQKSQGSGTQESPRTGTELASGTEESTQSMSAAGPKL